MLEKLGALGYVGGAVAAETTTPGADPKDKMEDFRIVNELMREGLLHARLGDLAQDMGAVDEAIRSQTQATELAPDVAAYWNSLGMTLGGSGRSAEAEHAFLQATRLDDKNSRYAYNLGLILQRQGRGAEARPWFEKTLALDPAFAPARDRLAGR